MYMEIQIFKHEKFGDIRTINKDGEQLLKIVTDNESDRPLYNPFKVRETMAGEIVYRDYDIVLAYDHSHTHERYASLTYGKVDDENPLIVLNTKVSDDGSFIDFCHFTGDRESVDQCSDIVNLCIA